MNYFIFTRMHLRTAYRDLTDAYMEYRTRLFELTAYPALLNQTDQRFRHVLVTSADLPRKWRDRLKKYGRSEVLEVDQTALLPGQAVKHFIEANASAGGCISANLDSDDMLPRKWVAQCYGAAKQHKSGRAHIYSLKTCVYSAQRGGVMHLLPYGPPTFAVSEREDFGGLWSVTHKQIGEICSHDLGGIDAPVLMLAHQANMCTGPSFGEKREAGEITYTAKEMRRIYGVDKGAIDEALAMDLHKEFVEREKVLREKYEAVRDAEKEKGNQA